MVATGWRIRDGDVGPLVEGFYAALARSLLLIDALHHAKLEAWRRGTSARTWPPSWRSAIRWSSCLSGPRRPSPGGPDC